MNLQATLDQLRKLKLDGMANAYDAAIKLPVHDQLSTELLIGRLVEAEAQHRVIQKTALYLRQSKLRYNRIERTQVLIFDDFGLTPMDAITRLAMLQILEDRYGKKPSIITSQLPVVKWFDFIGEPTIADAIMDRLAGNAHRIDLKGESLRKTKQEKKD